MTHSRAVAAADLLAAFAERTGLAPATAHPRRYLWTDAHAVCTWLALHHATGQHEPRRLALALVEQVHTTLGRHRPDDPRVGWISGLDEVAGRAHPTAGGLRIGKELPERRADEPFDAEREWQRDGQYFHYLTRWLHALACVADATGEGLPLRHAVELAQVACARFAHGSAGRRHLYWKMSIDLSRPLVASAGQHDAVDGLVTCLALRAACARHAPELAATLAPALAELRAMACGSPLATDDALGLGGLLTAAHTLVQLLADHGTEERELLHALLHAAALGVRAYAASSAWRQPVSRRLAFRELGLVLGLQAVPRIARLWDGRANASHGDADTTAALGVLGAHTPLAEHLLAEWLQPRSRATPLWHEHRDIDDVMLAAAMRPDGGLAA